MPFLPLRPARTLVLAAVALAAVPAAASASGQPSGGERLVVRGEATVLDRPCEAGVCPLELSGGQFRGTPVGTGAYAGRVELRVAELFQNGEGGVCAPLRGKIVLGAGSADRLILAVAGDSCQDGAGDVTETAFTGLGRFTVKRGTGRYAGATGAGLAVFAEDAADTDRMTLIGRIAR